MIFNTNVVLQGIVAWCIYQDSKVHGANMGPTWVLSAPDGPHVDPMNVAIRVVKMQLDHIWLMQYVFIKALSMPLQVCDGWSCFMVRT